MWHLDSDLSHAAALPCKWIEDEDGFALAVSVDARGERLHRVSGDLVRGPANLVVVPLGLFVDGSNARAGRQIVELVEEYVLPRVVELVGGISAAVEPCK